MTSILDMSASSDEDDVDFVPSKSNGDSDSSFSEEEASDDDCNTAEVKDKTPKKGQQTNEANKGDVDEKQRAKDLWESFLNDVEPPGASGNPKNSSIPATVIPSEKGTKAKEVETKTVSKVFEFAGETVIVDKSSNSLSGDSAVEKNNSPSLSCDSAVEKNNSPSVATGKPCVPQKRGINSVLGAIMNKSKKLTVLEKSLIDWKSFKEDEGIDNELEVFNKGKNGFIERKRFLERADLRSFEKEKSMRQTLRKK